MAAGDARRAPSSACGWTRRRTAARADEEGHWRQGGLTYYNPEDPALVVKKLTGPVYTLNLAHRAVRYRLLLMAGMPLFVVWALFNL